MLISPGHLYPTRSSELPIIKNNRIQTFKDIVGNEASSVEPEFELTKGEFAMMASLNQINFNYFTQFLDLVHIYGGKWVCLSYLILQIMLGMPLFMLYTFMSSYSKKSYLTFWECVPILEGLGYTIAAIRFTSELYNTAAAGLSLILIPEIFFDTMMKEIESCSYGRPHNQCIPILTKKDAPRNCPERYHQKENETVYISRQFYLRTEVMLYNQFDLTCCIINWQWLVAVLLVWVLIFSCSIFGIRRIRKITVNLQLIVAGVLFIASVYTFSMMGRFDHEIIQTNKDIIDHQFRFWVDMILHAAETNVLGNMIWLGTLKPKSLNPRIAALLICPIKLLIFILMVCFCSRIMQEILLQYKFKDATCLGYYGKLISLTAFFYGHDVIFAFIPDIMHRLDLGKILMLAWYIGIFYFAFVSPLYSLIGLVDSIVEKFKKLSKYRIFVYLVLCITGAVMNVILTLNISLSVTYTSRFFGIPLLTTVILLLVNLALMFIYSTKRIVDDFNFTYGEPPHKYWITFWRTAPIFSLFAFILMLTQLNTSVDLNFTNFQLVLGSYVQSSLLLSPIIILFWTKCCRHVKYRTLGMLSKPAPNWGPYNCVKRQARKFFYPQRDVKYRNYVLNCMHKCIAHSSKFYEENRRQTSKMHLLQEEMKSRALS